MGEVFIQYKGTDICLDFRCYKCGTSDHFDGFFAYYLKCGNCGQVYEMPSVVSINPIDETIHKNQCVQEMSDPYDQDVENKIEKGTCVFFSERYPKS